MTPDWIRVRLPINPSFEKIKHILKKRQLVTVCEEAHCPNIGECWEDKSTATFMIMGAMCTRICRFCAVATGKPLPLDEEEPKKIAEAVAEIGLHYVVLTSVTRDDLPDQGAGHFAECIKTIHLSNPETQVEVLIPDFHGDERALQTVVDARPVVIAHNIETVERLQQAVRDRRATYSQSIAVLRTIKEKNPAIYTKSSIMLGLGEREEEITATMQDLRAAGADIITLGQYLRPSQWHIAIQKYYSHEEFRRYEEKAKALGFLSVAAGPLVRSSYRAGELFTKYVKEEEYEKSSGHV